MREARRTKMLGRALPRWETPSRRSRRLVIRGVGVSAHYVALVICATVILIPILWTLSTALKEAGQVYEFPPRWIPQPAVWSNFVEAWSAKVPFNLFFRNTLVITLVPLVGSILSCS